MSHSTQFEATAGGLVLTNAILLYQSDGKRPDQFGARREGAAFASIHEVEHHEGMPAIAAGAPLSRGHLRQWAEALGRTAVPEILPANVLVAHPDMLAWWVPEQVRPAYFDLHRPPEGLKAIAKRSVFALPYPSHLFIATRSRLGVFALPASQRPTAETKVLFSPVLNVYVEGHLCWGNIPKPKGLGIEAMPAFERAVFESWSTHPNPGQETTVSGKGGLVALWDDLAARRVKRFPVNRLKQFRVNARQKGGGTPVTLGQLIAGFAR